jgi:hypothetical protein
MKKIDENWLEKQMMRDDLEVEQYKKNLVESFKQLKKDELFQSKKITIWTRIKTTLGL